MAIIRQSLTETANTFSQNQTLNGTANTAPNQTAASASSLMSRTLVDDEPFFNIARCFNPLPVPSTGVLRGTASVNTNGNYVNLAVASSPFTFSVTLILPPSSMTTWETTSPSLT